MDGPDERALVSRFTATRTEDAFVALYRLHTPRMYGLARRLLGQRGGADDAVQEAWIRAVERLGTFRWESTLASWLGGIVVNCCRERFRDREWSEPEEPVAPGGSETAALDLQRALDLLAPGYRSVLLLHDLYGYTHEEIGALLGIGAGTSRSQLARARGTVRRLLGEKDAAQP